MEDMPIDIHYNKLSDWLVKRRHCKQNWQESALVIRAKINTAIQDMPAHDDITKLLSGTYINYFHCLKIIEILKETEASSKTIFGSYSSKRMKDWQEVVKLYRVDSLYLAEAAQMLARNVNYEVPALKKQLNRCKKTQLDCTRKESDYNSSAAELRNKYTDMCAKLGIEGQNISNELLSLAAHLPEKLGSIGRDVKGLSSSLQYYSDFVDYINPSDKQMPVCPLLKTVINKGNITTYEWRTGEAPTSVMDMTSHTHIDDKNAGGDEAADEIDWGAIDFDEPSETTKASIDIGEDITIEVNDAGNAELTIDWEDNSQSVNIEEDGVAKGKDALTILDNPTTRFQFMDELMELENFLRQRLQEMTSGTDVIVMSLLQSAPISLQISDTELTALLASVSALTAELTSSKMQQLMSIRNSPRYVERVTEEITKVLDHAEKMAASARLMVIKRKESFDEEIETEPKIAIVKEKTMELKKELEKDIATKYKGRIVNIMGEINSM
ncbi:CDK5 regulatory subunit-associated protein 3-like [Watersipora subatra]|uniref:CDK5 regulatory subunit-associated protein 3-like n=1 Tax=Watersipora subatra TaxID=2589382 RepID=UPI00355B832D